MYKDDDENQAIPAAYARELVTPGERMSFVLFARGKFCLNANKEKSKDRRRGICTAN